MSKEVNYDHITPELVKQVEAVINDAGKHTYSVSRVFGAYNAVMQKKDKPQTCSSCLRNRVRELIKWKAGYDKATAKSETPVVDETSVVDETPVDPQYTDPGVPGYVAQEEGTVRYPMAEGLPFDFLPNEGTIVKGTVKLADGSAIKAGTYETAEGLLIAVQPGGKASIKEEDLT